MSITMILYYRGEEGNAKKFVDEMISSGTVALIKAENGNLSYEYFQSLDDANEIILIDSWINQEALDLHHASPMMKTITALRIKYNLHMEAKRFILDETALEKDLKFIKK